MRVLAVSEEGSAKISSGDTAWVLNSSALVFIMGPRLAFFYGELVRGKNALSTMLQSFIPLAIVGLPWVLWGYSLAFGPGIGGFIGNLRVSMAAAKWATGAATGRPMPLSIASFWSALAMTSEPGSTCIAAPGRG